MAQISRFAFLSDLSGLLTGSITGVYATQLSLAATGSTLDDRINLISGILIQDITNLVLTGSNLQNQINILSAASGNSGIAGSGSLNYVAKFYNNSLIGNSQIIDNGTNVGIGVSPGHKLDVSGTIAASGYILGQDFGFPVNTGKVYQSYSTGPSFTQSFLELLQSVSTSIGVNDPLRYKTVSNPQSLISGVWGTDTSIPNYTRILDGNPSTFLNLLSNTDYNNGLSGRRFTVDAGGFTSPGFITISNDFNGNYWGYDFSMEKGNDTVNWTGCCSTMRIPTNNTRGIAALSLGNQGASRYFRFTFQAIQPITAGAILISNLQSYSNQYFSSSIPVYINSGKSLITTNGLGVGTATPLQFLHSTGAIRTDAAYFSGSTNIADIFASQVSLNASGAKTTSLSGFLTSNFISGNGTAGYLTKYTGARYISQSFAFENQSGIGIKTTTPNCELDILGVTRSNGVVLGETIVSQGEAYNAYYKIATLPASSNNSKDHILLEGVYNNYVSAGNNTFKILAGNRGGLNVNYINGGMSNPSIEFYTEPNTGVAIWAKINSGSFATMSLNVTASDSFLMAGINVVTHPSFPTGIPTGTLSWSTSGRTPDVYYAFNKNVGFGTLSPSQNVHATGGIRTDLGFYEGANNINTIYATIASLSSYATVTDLQSTGSTLNSRLNSLSGWAASAANLQSTGSNLQNQINTISSNLTSTGVALGGKIDSLSGYSNNSFATVVNLAATGSTLNSKVNSLSGFVTSFYTTQVYVDAADTTLTNNLFNTGANLNSRINSLSGWAASAANLQSTGSNLQGQINTLTTNLTSSGVTLNGRINSLSGFLTSNYTDNAGLAANYATIASLSAYATTVNLGITGSVLNDRIVSLSGYSNNTFSTVANLAATGTTLNNKINVLSGYWANNPSGYITSSSAATVYTWTLDSPAAGGSSSQDHTSSFSSNPDVVRAALKVDTAAAGYAIGDLIPLDSVWTTGKMPAFSAWFNSTYLGLTRNADSPVYVMNKSNGSTTQIDLSDTGTWKIEIKGIKF